MFKTTILLTKTDSFNKKEKNYFDKNEPNFILINGKNITFSFGISQRKLNGVKLYGMYLAANSRPEKEAQEPPSTRAQPVVNVRGNN